MTIFAELRTTAKKVNNFIEDATDNGIGNDKFDSTTLQEYEVPPGKRWFLLGGNVLRDVSSTCTIDIRDSANNIIQSLGDYTAGATRAVYPCQSSTTNHQQVGNFLILDAGEYVNIAFGTAQGGGATASCVVLEVDA